MNFTRTLRDVLALTSVTDPHLAHACFFTPISELLLWDTLHLLGLILTLFFWSSKKGEQANQKLLTAKWLTWKPSTTGLCQHTLRPFNCKPWLRQLLMPTPKNLSLSVSFFTHFLLFQKVFLLLKSSLSGQGREHGFDPWSSKIPHESQREAHAMRCLCTTTRY